MIQFKKSLYDLLAIADPGMDANRINRLQSSIRIQGIPVIFDTDANNELDDQHALAYLLLNDSTFQCDWHYCECHPKRG